MGIRRGAQMNLRSSPTPTYSHQSLNLLQAKLPPHRYTTRSVSCSASSQLSLDSCSTETFVFPASAYHSSICNRNRQGNRFVLILLVSFFALILYLVAGAIHVSNLSQLKGGIKHYLGCQECKIENSTDFWNALSLLQNRLEFAGILDSALRTDIAQIADSESVCVSHFSDASGYKAVKALANCLKGSYQAQTLLNSSSSASFELWRHRRRMMDYIEATQQGIAKFNALSAADQQAHKADLDDIGFLVQEYGEYFSSTSTEYFDIVKSIQESYRHSVHPTEQMTSGFAMLLVKRGQDRVLKSLAKALPEYIAVRRLPNSQALFLDPNFLQSFQSSLLEHENLDSSLDILVATKEFFDSYYPSTEIADGVFNELWLLHLYTNARAVEYLQFYESSAVNAAVLNRDEFINFVNQELTSYIGDIVLNFVDPPRKITLVLYEIFQIGFKQTELTREVILSGLGRALSKFASKSLSKGNYGSNIRGSQTDRELTSETLCERKLSSRFYYHPILNLLSNQEERTFELALLDELAITNGWLFQGDEATLTICLSEPIYIEQVAIANLPKELSKSKGRAIATKFEVFVEVSDVDTQRALSELSVADFSYNEMKLNHGRVILPKNFVKVGTYEYDLNFPFEIQAFTFPIGVRHAMETTAVRKISFRFQQNTNGYKTSTIGAVMVNGSPARD
ncbi:uncharacterized protein V1516DRAFT_686441 [Lipomyces oligophaga]|uniref:uncharacterized protein n=1 Tax=Lipomyces oligophaga TaxID=45792 RepID=UPI0034CD5993